MHNLACPFGFNTGTIGEHHLVGSVCLTITPSFSIRFYSFSTFAIIGSGILHGVDVLYGAASHFTQNFTGSHWRRPIEDVTSSTRLIRFISQAKEWLIKLGESWSATNMSTQYFWFLYSTSVWKYPKFFSWPPTSSSLAIFCLSSGNGLSGRYCFFNITLH